MPGTPVPPRGAWLEAAIDGGSDAGMDDVSSSVALSADGTRMAMGAWPELGYQEFPELSEGLVRVYDAQPIS